MRVAVASWAAAVTCLALGCSEIAGLGDPPSIDTLVPEASAHGLAGPDAGAVDTADDAPDAMPVSDEPDIVADEGTPGDGNPGGETSPDDGGLDGASGPFISCADWKRANPDAGSGLYSIQNESGITTVYCEMTLDDGGWTAFFVNPLGAGNQAASFEDQDFNGDPVDHCPSLTTSCLRHLPRDVTSATEFLAECNGAAVRFNVTSSVLAYWTFGVQVDWQPTRNAVAVSGNADPSLATWFWGGGQGVDGWVLTRDKSQPNPTTFASAETQAGWDYCNGVGYGGLVADAGAYPLVWLFYR